MEKEGRWERSSAALRLSVTSESTRRLLDGLKLEAWLGMPPKRATKREPAPLCPQRLGLRVRIRLDSAVDMYGSLDINFLPTLRNPARHRTASPDPSFFRMDAPGRVPASAEGTKGGYDSREDAGR